MGVGRILFAHLLDRLGEQVGVAEDVCVLGEEAEDQTRHEMIHVVATRRRSPIGVVLEQFDVEPVQAAGRPNVEGAFANLLNGRDASQRQEEPEVVRKVLNRRRRLYRR